MRCSYLTMCAAAAALTCSARAALTFEWWFFDAEVTIEDLDGPLADDFGEQVMNDPMGPWDNYASAEHSKAGEGVADISADASISICGIYNLWADAAVTISAIDPGPVGLSRVHTYVYMQLAVTVTDTAYTFEHLEQIDTFAGEGVTQTDHFVNTIAETTLLPREDPYLVLWAALDYTADATFNTGPIDGVAETHIDLTFIPEIPGPAAASLLMLGVLGGRRRRR
jgi:hypothetical protein